MSVCVSHGKHVNMFRGLINAKLPDYVSLTKHGGVVIFIKIDRNSPLMMCDDVMSCYVSTVAFDCISEHFLYQISQILCIVLHWFMMGLYHGFVFIREIERS